MTTNYPIIANCNYESSEDTTIDTIRRAVDAGLTDDPELVDALDALESTLSDDAESKHPDAMERCAEAEAAVIAAWTLEVQAEVEATQRARYRD